MIACLVVWSKMKPSVQYLCCPSYKCSTAGSQNHSSQHFLTYISDGKSTTWSVRLGQLLLAAKKRDTTAFYDTLKLVRAEQIVPLSAASFERGSYQRGYEFIVRYLGIPLLYSPPIHVTWYSFLCINNSDNIFDILLDNTNWFLHSF